MLSSDRLHQLVFYTATLRSISRRFLECLGLEGWTSRLVSSRSWEFEKIERLGLVSVLWLNVLWTSQLCVNPVQRIQSNTLHRICHDPVAARVRLLLRRLDWLPVNKLITSHISCSCWCIDVVRDIAPRHLQEMFTQYYTASIWLRPWWLCC